MGARDQHFKHRGNNAAASCTGLFGVQGGHECVDGIIGEGRRG